MSCPEGRRARVWAWAWAWAWAGDPEPTGHLPAPRIGNLLVPNDNYCKFEDWLMPILDQMVLEQNTEVGGAGEGVAGAPWEGLVPHRRGGRCRVNTDVLPQGMKWTPSKMIARLGKEINSPESVYYWAQKVGSLGGRPSPP